MARVVQLEIRGVGGATASEILGGTVRQVDGDRVAGFYEPAIGAPAGAHAGVISDRGVDAVDGGSAGAPPDRHVEAYEWGRLTSGGWSTALWWVLLPFTLLNMAGWTFRPLDPDAAADRPEEPPGSSLWWGRLLVVCGGVALTVLYTAWILLLGTELVALHCGGDPQCSTRWYLFALRWSGGHPLSRLTVGLLLSLLVLFGLFLFVTRSQARLEGFEPDRDSRAAGRDATRRLRRNTRLHEPGFWYRWDEYRRLLRWHLGATLVTVGAVAGHASQRLPADPPDAWVSVRGAGLVVLVAAALWVLTAPERSVGTERAGEYRSRWQPRVRWTALHLGFMLAGFVAALAVTDAIDPPPSDGRIGLVLGIQWLASLVYALGLLLLGLLAWRATRRRDGAGTGGFRYAAPAVAAGLAFYIAAVGFGSLAYLLGRGLLGTQETVAAGYAVSVVDLFGLGLVVVAVVALVRFVSVDRQVEAVRQEYFPDRTDLSEREESWVSAVAGARWTAQAPRGADVYLSGLLLLLLVGQTVQIIRTEGFSLAFWRWEPLTAPLFGIEQLGWVHAAAATGVALYLFPGVQLIRLSARNRAQRRQLGKVWDVLGFWPRRFHPLAAPCYAERAVPEFRARIAQCVAAGDSVLVSAHSQGTVVAFAALEQLRATGDGEPLRRIALVTFGCPLATLYAPFFPFHFGLPATCAHLRDALCRLEDPPGARAWQNFFHPTDYIGREVFLPPAGVVDPVAGEATDVHLPEARQPLFPYESHGGYERDPELRAWVERVAAQLASA